MLDELLSAAQRAGVLRRAAARRTDHVDSERGADAHDGFKFYRSVNGVWLTDRVPVDYLKAADDLDQRLR